MRTRSNIQYALVVQRIARKIPVLKMGVRFPPRVFLSLLSFKIEGFFLLHNKLSVSIPDRALSSWFWGNSEEKVCQPTIFKPSTTLIVLKPIDNGYDEKGQKKSNKSDENPNRIV